MNIVFFTGRLTKDPELKFIAGSGKAVCNFSIAVDRPFSKEKQADFFRVVVWGKTAENCAEYLEKGRKVAVKGHLINEQYEKDGQKMTFTKIIADNVEFLEWGEKKQSDEFQEIEDDRSDILF